MSGSPRPVSRYHRRILGWGGGLACLLYVVGAPIYLDRVESDLTERVTADLEAAGFTGFTVSFSGQTGSIDCAAPLGDPQGALDVAYDVRGVHAMDALPDACRVRTTPPDDGTSDDSSDDASTLPATAPTTTSTAPETTTTVAADFGSVVDVIGGNPAFSLLRQLLDDAGLTETLSGDGPFTFFAPIDAAFDALPADAVAQLRADPDLLDAVLRHHVVADRLASSDLETGELATLADDELDVEVDGDDITIDGAVVVQPDVRADNGVVHAVDQLLVPDGVDLTASETFAPVSATYSEGSWVLEGVVRSEVERSVLVDAAVAATAPDAVVDELSVDPDVGIDEAVATELATLIAAVPASLVTGTVSSEGSMLAVTGTYVGQDQRSAIEALAAELGAESELTERPAATTADASDLEDELNDYVAANPILFEPSSSVFDESALPILDEVARRASEFAGVSITVEGHTDSDGGTQENLILSRLRAIAVRDALVERGLDEAAVTADGFGSSRPILGDDGVEDKAASRRVEFRVVVS